MTTTTQPKYMTMHGATIEYLVYETEPRVEIVGINIGRFPNLLPWLERYGFDPEELAQEIQSKLSE